MARLLLALVLALTALLVWVPMPALGAWRTLSGKPPVIVADGGTSGLYPDQTIVAYQDSLNYSLPGVVLSCDLQMTGSEDPQFNATGTGICRKRLNLENSTTIAQTAPDLNNTYVVDGVSKFGWFAIDLTYETLVQVALATQSVLSRSPAFDGYFSILKPEFIAADANPPGFLASAPASTWWMNCEYTTFIEANSKFNATKYTIEAIQQFVPGYVSAPEISLLRKIKASPNTNRTKIFYKFLETATLDPSTNQSYESLKQNLTFLKTFASGILVPKSYIWPIDDVSWYLQAPTTLVEDAHKANLEVYAYEFSNDQYPNSYNYTFDPVTELLYYIEKYNFSVDGIFTGFPATSSEAISCYASASRNASGQIKESIAQKQVVISHNGDSGQFPAATTAAYQSAIAAGVEYIDCIVQITSDSVPICRPTPNLIDSTDVTNTAFFPSLFKAYPNFNKGATGIYTFDLSLADIRTLKSTAYSPEASGGFYRDPGYDGQFPVLTLAEFLAIAKDNKVGALIDIQNAVYLRNVQNLAVVDAVVETLSAAGYNSSDKVILQSEESSVLSRLRILDVNYPLMYEVLWDGDHPISLDASDFAQIKEIASSVNLDVRLLEPYDKNFFIQGPPTNLIDLAHDQNLTVFFQVQQNEPIVYAFDLMSDPTLQLFSLAHYGVEGFITDFPATVTNFQKNQCSGSGLSSGVMNFSIPLVVPGHLSLDYTAPSPMSAPPPNLVIPEAPLSGIPVLSPAPTPSPVPSAASHLSLCVLVLLFSVMLHLPAMW